MSGDELLFTQDDAAHGGCPAVPCSPSCSLCGGTGTFMDRGINPLVCPGVAMADNDTECELTVWELLAEARKDRNALARDLDQCKKWITVARERLQEMPADEEIVDLINTCPWWDSPENAQEMASPGKTPT